jgi:hypothetical protein
MLWKERYVSRTSGIVKVAGFVVFLFVAAILTYATYQFAAPAFAELRDYGYTATGRYQDRLSFNGFLRAMHVLFYLAWCLGIASNAASGVVSEHEEDTWTSLTTTPLTGVEILRAKMFGAVWATRWIGLFLLVFWLLGLSSAAVHPLGLAAVAVETAVFLWFVTALGVSLSLRLKTSVRAQSATIGILLIVNGVYMLCCIPLQPDSILVAAGVTPMIEALSLMSYRDVGSLFASSDQARNVEAILTCVLGMVLYGAAALVLTLHAFATFDEKIGRPFRRWGPPYASDAAVKFLEEDAV